MNNVEYDRSSFRYDDYRGSTQTDSLEYKRRSPLSYPRKIDVLTDWLYNKKMILFEAEV